MESLFHNLIRAAYLEASVIESEFLFGCDTGGVEIEKPRATFEIGIDGKSF